MGGAIQASGAQSLKYASFSFLQRTSLRFRRVRCAARRQRPRSSRCRLHSLCARAQAVATSASLSGNPAVCITLCARTVPASRGFNWSLASACRQAVRLPGQLPALLIVMLWIIPHASSQTCTNLCLKQVACSGGGTISISGTVCAPNGTDPSPNVLAYIPNSPMAARARVNKTS